MKGVSMSRFTLSRRAFVKTLAATGAFSVMASAASYPLAALAETETVPSAEIKRIRSYCRGCGKMECVVWVTVQDGKAIKIEGDESAFQSNGSCCSKSQASLQAAYHPDRLRYPMRRTAPKGAADAGWERITWEEALQANDENLSKIVAKYGGKGVMTWMGTSRFWGMGSARIPRPYNGGAMNGHGAAQICKGVRRASGGYTIENGIFFNETVGLPRVYVQWGTAPSYSNYDDTVRTISETAMRSKCYINVDPRVSAEGKETDFHLPLRAGTDGAMILGWTHLVMKNDWQDDEFCKRWSNGPFLYCEDLKEEDIQTFKNGKWAYAGSLDVKTRLLSQADLVEGGSPSKFMVWDNLANGGAGGLCWFESNEEAEQAGMWEGEDDYCFPTTFTEYTKPCGDIRDGNQGLPFGRIPDPTQFKVERDPELWYEGEVTLKDGRAVKVKSVWQKYWDDIVSKYTPEYVAKVCEVDQSVLEGAVEAWAGNRYDPRFANGGIHYQLAPEQTATAFQNFRALGILSSIVGGYDNPGTNRGMSRVPVDAGGVMNPYNSPLIPKADSRPKVDADKYIVWTTSDAHMVLRAVLEDDPYPIRSSIAITGDFLNQCNANYSFEALCSMDFNVGANLWHHPHTDQSDILLPCQHWLEIPGFARISQGSHGSFGMSEHCIEPLGEAKFDVEIGILQHKQAGIPYYDPAETDEKGYPDDWSPISRYLDAQVKGTGMTGQEYRDKFQTEGTFSCKEYYPEIWGTYQRYRTGKLRQRNAMQTYPGDNKPGMTTHTMKCEIWSTALETLFAWRSEEEMPEPLQGKVDDISQIAFPEWIPAPLSMENSPEQFEKYPLLCTTGARNPTYFHTEHRQLPWCRELWPVPRMTINPADAEPLGLSQGDWAWIENDQGKIRQMVDLYAGIKQGTINLEHAWWFPEINDASHGWQLCHCNVLVDRWAQDPFVGSSQLRAYPVKVYKATAENSPFGNPVPCADDGTPIICSASDPRLKEWTPVYEGREE